MIKQVDELLQQWAEWVDRRESGGLGYKGSSLNAQMAAACSEYPSASSRGVDGRIEELMSLVDVVLCRMVSPSSKAVIDRYYRGRVGGVVAVEGLIRRRSGASSSRIADELGVNSRTVQRWLHNGHVEFANAMDSVRYRIKVVGVMGVVADVNKAAANDCA